MKTTLRKTLFWIHLVAGLVAAVFIAVMSATGIAIAFEHEITDWIDREVSAADPAAGDDRLPLDALEAEIAKQFPDFRPTTVQILRKPTEAYRFQAGRESMLFVDPYTGNARAPKSGPAHDILHTLTDWHRWLGMEGEHRAIGKLINGIANFAFLILCLTGLYLWFPRQWSWRAVRPVLWFRRTSRSKARDFNWHNVFGFWNLPVLIILVGTAVVFSFAWAHRLVFQVVGETPPEHRDFRMMLVPPSEVPTPPAEVQPLPLDTIVRQTQKRHPEWEAIALNYPRRAEPDATAAPINLAWFEPAPFLTAGRVMTFVDPYTGEELSSVSFGERSLGLRARVWMRFLHTGEAFGLVGKIIATFSTAASLVLVYTGLALVWRRLVKRPKRA